MRVNDFLRNLQQLYCDRKASVIPTGDEITAMVSCLYSELKALLSFFMTSES